MYLGWSSLKFQVLFGTILIILAFFRISCDLLVSKNAIHAAQHMRKNFCDCILNAPMTFFMTENAGPLCDVSHFRLFLQIIYN